MTNEELEEWLETAITDSFDLCWTSLDAAKLIVSRMQAEGLVLVKAEPDAVERVARALFTAQPYRAGIWDGTEGPLWTAVAETHKPYYRRLATAAIAAITGRV